jgi:hypothetical protein
MADHRRRLVAEPHECGRGLDRLLQRWVGGALERAELSKRGREAWGGCGDRACCRPEGLRRRAQISQEPLEALERARRPRQGLAQRLVLSGDGLHRLSCAADQARQLGPLLGDAAHELAARGDRVAQAVVVGDDLVEQPGSGVEVLRQQVERLVEVHLPPRYRRSGLVDQHRQARARVRPENVEHLVEIDRRADARSRNERARRKPSLPGDELEHLRAEEVGGDDARRGAASDVRLLGVEVRLGDRIVAGADLERLDRAHRDTADLHRGALAQSVGGVELEPHLVGLWLAADDGQHR